MKKHWIFAGGCYIVNVYTYYAGDRALGITNILELLTGIALFLFGISLMGSGLNMVAGSRLELILYRLTSSPVKGIVLGTGVTALIQSSSATSVMVVGFVNSGMMQFSQAIYIILGSILGTSITGWIACLSSVGGSSGIVGLFSTATITGIFAVVGICLQKFSKNQKRNQIGGILMGFAVLMFGMSTMSGSVAPLRESAAFIDLLTEFSNPALGILVGAVFACVVQSSAAAVGVLQALAGTGALTFAAAFPILLGIAIGGAVPVLLSALGANKNGVRTALVHLLIDIFGAAICGVLFYAVDLIHPLSIMGLSMTNVSVAALNTVFRFAVIIVIVPLTKFLEKIACRLIKDDAGELSSLQDMDRLEERFLAHPAVAIEQSRLTVNSMAQKSMENLFDSFALLSEYSDKGFETVEKLENIVDKYEDKIGSYLIRITGHELTPEQNGQVAKYLHTLNDFERISDHAVNLAECARELHEKEISFSADGMREMNVLISAVREIVRLSFTAFIENDLNAVYRVEPLEELIDNLCDELKLHHIDRLQKGLCTLTHGFVFTDLLTNLERVGDHCSNIAVAMIELESNEFDPHEYIDSLSAAHTRSFDEYFAEYSKQFAL